MTVEASEIRILEDRVVDQIAAGEVVERPASVVKELIENAVDAQATNIVVLLKEGGRALVQVSDDGIGMSEQDALLSIERHATSKIRDVGDLVGIRSFGFRGEALPSIAAVSRFELTTRRREDLDATRIRVEGGKLTDVRPAAGAHGTSIRVRSLFYNVPARKAFLRVASTELGHCVQAVARAALGRPAVGFTLEHSGRSLIETAAGCTLERRATDVLGVEGKRLGTVEAEDGELRLTGLASPPGIHRATGNGAIYLFVNGRWVRDLTLRRAIQQAYADLVPRGRYPIVVLDLQLAGEGVDINVHPTKAEVQFSDPARVGAFVATALRDFALAATGRSATPRAHLRRTPSKAPPLPLGATRTPPPSRLATPARAAPPARTAHPPGPPPPEAEPPRRTPPPARQAPPPAAPPPVVAESPPDPLPEPAGPVVPPEPVGPPVHYVGVIGERWAVGDADGALYLLDAGRLLRRVQSLSAVAPGRRLLEPLVLRMSDADVRSVEYHAEELSEVGIEAVRFSATEVALRTLPASLASADPPSVLEVALLALRRGADVRKTWGSRLPPARVPGAVGQASELARLADQARALGIPVSGRRVDPATLEEL